ncbi:TATA-binding protein-associated factor mot1 [Microbotryomycetes sp. JL221]|nr:TATA-binding protein-associated factor mot1 [Microbotryomycetes sp. JL221]
MSRLDRLILLLETGSTPSVRLTAARQLGQLAGVRVAHSSIDQRHHASQIVNIKPEDSSSSIHSATDTTWRGVDGEWNEVIQVVARVLPYLQSRSADTRQAAASALGHISQAVGVWDPTLTAPVTTDTKENNPIVDTVSSSTEATSTSATGQAQTLSTDRQLSLDSFDVIKVLSEGTILLSSSGTEYASLSGLSADELIKAQQAALGKLGLGFAPGSENDIGVDVGAELAAAGSAPSEVMTGASTATDAIEKNARAELDSTKPGLSNLPPPKFLNGASSSSENQQAQTSATSSSAASPSANSTVTAAMTTESTADEADPYAGLSARERNKLKRKRKTEAKSGVLPNSSSSSSSAPATKVRVVPSKTTDSQTAVATTMTTTTTSEESSEMTTGSGVQEDGKVVIDPGLKAKQKAQQQQKQGGEVSVDETRKDWADMEVKVGEWPWRGPVERMAVGLVSPLWETRHGAALGLKELLRLQGSGGGKLAGVAHEENQARHTAWCEDLAARLLCVFALDRFGDYLSDQVVAPVRETASQALATLLPVMRAPSVVQVQRILIDMVSQGGAPPTAAGLDARSTNNGNNSSSATRPKYVWQVRHSGLVGLKYLVAVKGDLLRATSSASVIKHVEDEDQKPPLDALNVEPNFLLKSAVDAAVLGLKDRDDDVRSAAAGTLIPIADAVVDNLPSELQEIVGVIWDCLGDLKDDLSSSVGAVMDLLAKLLSFPPVLTLLQSTSGPALSQRIPLLYPFFRHTITSVRLAVLRAVQVFLTLPSVDHTWIDDRLVRLLYQNLMVEDRLEIRNATSQAWNVCLSIGGTHKDAFYATLFAPHIEGWFRLLYSMIGKALDPSLFWSAKAAAQSGGFVYNVDKAMLAQDLSLIPQETVWKCRVAAATAMGQLIAAWPFGIHDSTFSQHLENGLKSTSAFERFAAATVIEEWSSLDQLTSTVSLAHRSTLASRLVQEIHTQLASEAPAFWLEMQPSFQHVQKLCTGLYTALSKQGQVPDSRMPEMPAGQNFTLRQATQVAANYQALQPYLGKGIKVETIESLEGRKRVLDSTIAVCARQKERHDMQTSAALGAAVIALQAIPVKITPVIRSITNSVKTESYIDLQQRSASSIAAFIDLCTRPNSPVKTNPSDKLIKNLCTFLCQDVSRTPIFASSKNVKRGILTLMYNPATGETTRESKDKEKHQQQTETQESVAAKLVFRGAEFALSKLAELFGDDLLERSPKLWTCMSEALLRTYGSGEVAAADAHLASDDINGQELLDSLTVLPTVAQKLTPAVQSRLTPLFPLLALATRSSFSVVRYAVAQCFAALCEVVPTEGMKHVVEMVLPVLADPVNVNNRRGAVELASHLVELLDVKILPYVIFLVVPILGRMSDSDDDVRLVATNTFAKLIKLVPLEAGLPDPPGFSQDLLEKRQHEREFLTQLLDGNRVVEYKISIPIEVELRKYQRDGVSWLAFLAKYQLHGLLCDDMGLGKTLQTICILGSMHHERAERYKRTQSPDAVHLPSLIVCPPTLTGHWAHEIRTYAKNLRPLLYTGPRAERTNLVKTFTHYDAIITSYDVVRNDIELLGSVDWHYCILDEGHVIKNSKTKLTKAVKTIKAIHRLILSGTPIQNNVLELWSLFDFLMPGFLGSESTFYERFGKPIQASRDAKSSSKEQEAGALALEALHKQVLPFILRRLKEDVLDDLPPKIIQDYYCELSPLQKQLYDDFSMSQGQQIAGQASTGNSQPQHVFQALQYLRKLVNHPALVVKPELPQHQHVIDKLATKGQSLRDVSHAPKLDALRQILLDCGIGKMSSKDDKDEADDEEGAGVSQHRCLIFCQLKTMLDIVEHDLFKLLMPSVTYMRLDGSTDVSKRHAIVQKFNADPSIDCLLLTTHVGGLGLNLTGADTVVFVEHDWNPMKDLQAMDRAHRLGQKKVVNVYRLIMRGTLEEKIMGLQRFKLNIASSVVTQQNSDLASLGTDQVLDLFNVSTDDGPKKLSSSSDTKRLSQKALLEGIDDLPADDEYQDLNLDAFLGK